MPLAAKAWNFNVSQFATTLGDELIANCEVYLYYNVVVNSTKFNSVRTRVLYWTLLEPLSNKGKN